MLVFRETVPVAEGLVADTAAIANSLRLQLFPVLLRVESTILYGKFKFHRRSKPKWRVAKSNLLVLVFLSFFTRCQICLVNDIEMLLL